MKPSREILYKYMAGILHNKNCLTFQINGVEDHLHILMKLHPNVALASLIKDIKVSTNHFIKEKRLFPAFPGWQDGYGAFTYSKEALPNLIRYVQNQEAHHGYKTYEDEYITFLEEHGVEYDPRYIFD